MEIGKERRILHVKPEPYPVTPQAPVEPNPRQVPEPAGVP